MLQCMLHLVLWCHNYLHNLAYLIIHVLQMEFSWNGRDQNSSWPWPPFYALMNTDRFSDNLSSCIPGSAKVLWTSASRPNVKFDYLELYIYHASVNTHWISFLIWNLKTSFLVVSCLLYIFVVLTYTHTKWDKGKNLFDIMQADAFMGELCQNCRQACATCA